MSEDPTTNEPSDEPSDEPVVDSTTDSPSADSTPAEPTPSESAAPAPTAPPASNTRTIVLFVLLAIALSALGYDRFVARPAVAAAHKMINDKANERSTSSKKQLDNTEVAKLFGREPSEHLEGKHYCVEKFSWMGGLPWRTYDCWVVYSPSNDGDKKTYRFNSAYLNEEPEEQYMPGFKDTVAEEAPLPGDPSGFGPPGGGPPGGGPPGGGPPGGGGFGRPPIEGGRPPGEEPGDDEPKEGDQPKEGAERKIVSSDPAAKKDAEKKDAEKKDAEKKDAEKKDAEKEDA